MRIFDWVRDLKERHPIFWWGGVLPTLGAVALYAFMLMPNTPVLTALGIDDFRSRLKAGVEASYWGYRVLVGRESLDRPRVIYGTIAGVNKTGSLVLSVPQNGDFELIHISFANINLKTVDLRHLTRVVAGYKDQNARIEVYRDDRSVVWVKEQPLNLAIIKSGAAQPETNPVTNIVDLAFAGYYWRIFTGESKQNVDYACQKEQVILACGV